MNTSEQIERFLYDISRGLAENSKLAYRMGMTLFTEFFKGRDPATIESTDIADWMHWLAKVKDNKPQTVRFRLAPVKRFFVWLVDAKVLPEEKLDIFLARRLPKLVRIPTQRQFVTDAQHARIMQYIRSGKPKRWWETACLLCWNTGLRFSDVANFKWEQVDFGQNLITVTPIKTRRLGKAITIPMDEELRQHLVKLKAQPYYESPFVIPDMAGTYSEQKNGRQMIASQFRTICRNAACPTIHFHCYRHAFVSRLLNAGVEPLIIASMTGHSVRQIASYAHVSDHAKREAMAKAAEAMKRAALDRKPRNLVELAAHQP